MATDVYHKYLLRQMAVYWPPSGGDKFGQPAFGSAVQIKCRWSDVTIERSGKEGEEGRTELDRTWILVDRDVEIGGALKLGLLSDIGDPTALPFDNTDTWEIRKVQKIPSRRGTQFVRRVTL